MATVSGDGRARDQLLTAPAAFSENPVTCALLRCER
jgi:hypothetical protein